MLWDMERGRVNEVCAFFVKERAQENLNVDEQERVVYGTRKKQ